MSLAQLLNQDMPKGSSYWQTLIYAADHALALNIPLANAQHFLSKLTGKRRVITAETIRKKFRQNFMS